MIELLYDMRTPDRHYVNSLQLGPPIMQYRAKMRGVVQPIIAYGSHIVNHTPPDELTPALTCYTEGWTAQCSGWILELSWLVRSETAGSHGKRT
jgi:hypothetical protein